MVKGCIKKPIYTLQKKVGGEIKVEASANNFLPQRRKNPEKRIHENDFNKLDSFV